jgi:hypothetical protein
MAGSGAGVRTLNRLATDFRELVPPEPLVALAPLQCRANVQPSGVAHPCSLPEYRVSDALRLSRFAALYASHIAIPDRQRRCGPSLERHRPHAK